MADKTRAPQASQTTLKILRLLEQNFAHGLAPSDIAKALHISPSLVTGHVNALESEGFAERIPETGRIRPSVRFARTAVSILNDLDKVVDRATELKSRITRTN